MLKKIVHMVLVLLLTVATSGFTISEHYCGGHLFSVSLFKAEQCSCGNHCKDCHTTIKQIKVSDNYSVSEAIHPDAPTTADLFSNYNIDYSALIPTAEVSSFFLYQPPPPEAQNLFALFQSFRC